MRPALNWRSGPDPPVYVFLSTCLVAKGKIRWSRWICGDNPPNARFNNRRQVKGWGVEELGLGTVTGSRWVAIMQGG